ncbi:efflux transporter outer membrane subunit [Acidocella sp. KAb 2-4]|uniref:efflux transporter outer membrane subunit n=1 Tax=Acidocella sp. KAb 2-4 TaxID=2885158 RepID=UPI001D08ACFF|nr:efflux transporter outer membrane subunit [Acidocella sp. KAb 2-4]MCB5944920.1 efflux transporter outer membrane subunit [Acidocella sp. KAb 2-4]
MKPQSFRRGLIYAALSLALPGCAVGPDYHTPKAPDAPLTPSPLPATTADAGGVAQHFAVGADIAGDWWTLYHSPQLNTLIAQALANNPSLAAAQATLLQAEENLRADEGVLVPSVSGSLGAQRNQGSTAAGAAFGSTRAKPYAPYTLYNASLSVSYALDLWGGARRTVEGAAAQADYQRNQLEAAYLTLTANIVTAAVNLASLSAQIDATNQVIAAERQLLSILQTQVSLGGAAQAQVLQQQAQLAQAEAALPPLQSQYAQAQNQLAAYTGTLPGNFQPQDFTLASLTLPADLPVSVPSALVAQRPDIRAAAAQLHAATANVGVADANMLPQITLSAQIGHESITTGALFTPQTLLWNIVAGLTQPIFQGGQLTAQRKAAIAALRAAGAQYQATVITAFQNVADVLAALQYDAIEQQSADAAASAAAQSLSVTEAQYQLGGQPFTAVLSAQTVYQNALQTQAKARAARLANTAALYQALGGGWWHRQDVARECCGVIP